MSVVPKGAKHKVEWDSISANAITNAMIADDAVAADQLLESDDYVMGTLEATEVKGTTRLVTKQGTHTGVALADLTATFGDPAAIPNGSLFVYKNSTDAKTYLVVVIASVFQIEELTPVTA